jgi:hypothetical protein
VPPTRPARRERLAEALALTSSRLRAAGIWHCLAFGTLLGAVRAGDLIEWDHDLDLFVRPADLGRIAEACSDERLTLTPIRLAPGWLALNPGDARGAALPGLSLSLDGTGVGELWAPVLFSDGVLRVVDLPARVSLWPQTALPAFVFEELREVTVRGGSYPAPARAELLLEWLYGADWREPRRAPADGGRREAGRGRSGDRVAPALAEQIALCESQGWDRSVYAGQPAWPPRLAAAGPAGVSERAAATSGSDWWRSLAEVGERY